MSYYMYNEFVSIFITDRLQLLSTSSDKRRGKFVLTKTKCMRLILCTVRSKMTELDYSCGDFHSASICASCVSPMKNELTAMLNCTILFL